MDDLIRMVKGFAPGIATALGGHLKFNITRGKA
jgi:hypothetical protein